MEERLGIFLLFIMTFMAGSDALPKRTAFVPGYMDCVSSADCDKSECCVLGSGRFTIPKCTPKGDIKEPCRFDSEPFNTRLYYPDDSVIPLHNVYFIMCPCMDGLTCLSHNGTCADPSENNKFNYLDDDNFDSN